MYTREQKIALVTRIRDGLDTQQSRALSDDGFCMYRDARGNKCAIGQIIPDELYTPDMETSSVEAINTQTSQMQKLSPINQALVNVLYKAGFDIIGDHELNNLLIDCQSFHDNFYNIKEIIERFDKLILNLQEGNPIDHNAV